MVRRMRVLLLMVYVVVPHLDSISSHSDNSGIRHHQEPATPVRQPQVLRRLYASVSLTPALPHPAQQ
jgi:hypothetical protein